MWPLFFASSPLFQASRKPNARLAAALICSAASLTLSGLLDDTLREYYELEAVHLAAVHAEQLASETATLCCPPLAGLLDGALREYYNLDEYPSLFFVCN